MTFLPEAVRMWRSIENVTLRDLAKEIGITHTVLHRFETNKEINAENFRKILRWMLDN